MEDRKRCRVCFTTCSQLFAASVTADSVPAVRSSDKMRGAGDQGLLSVPPVPTLRDDSEGGPALGDRAMLSPWGQVSTGALVLRDARLGL